MQQASVPFLVLGQDILRTVYTHKRGGHSSPSWSQASHAGTHRAQAPYTMHTTLPPPSTHHSPVVSSRPQHDCHGMNGVPQLGVERHTELPASQEAMSKLSNSSDSNAASGTTSLGALLKAKFDNKN